MKSPQVILVVRTSQSSVHFSDGSSVYNLKHLCHSHFVKWNLVVFNLTTTFINLHAVISKHKDTTKCVSQKNKINKYINVINLHLPRTSYFNIISNGMFNFIFFWRIAADPRLIDSTPGRYWPEFSLTKTLSFQLKCPFPPTTPTSTCFYRSK